MVMFPSFEQGGGRGGSIYEIIYVAYNILRSTSRQHSLSDSVDCSILVQQALGRGGYVAFPLLLEAPGCRFDVRIPGDRDCLLVLNQNADELRDVNQSEAGGSARK